MTPQQLMDLPGYGAAEKWLRKAGKWRLTPEECLHMALHVADREDSDDLVLEALEQLENQQ